MGLIDFCFDCLRHCFFIHSFYFISFIHSTAYVTLDKISSTSRTIVALILSTVLAQYQSNWVQMKDAHSKWSPRILIQGDCSEPYFWLLHKWKASHVIHCTSYWPHFFISHDLTSVYTLKIFMALFLKEQNILNCGSFEIKLEPHTTSLWSEGIFFRKKN